MHPNQHLAQLNIGRFRHATDHLRMADFMYNLDLVNAIAERSQGFVWRLKTTAVMRPISGRSPIRRWR